MPIYTDVVASRLAKYRQQLEREGGNDADIDGAILKYVICQLVDAAFSGGGGGGGGGSTTPQIVSDGIDASVDIGTIVTRLTSLDTGKLTQANIESAIQTAADIDTVIAGLTSIDSSIDVSNTSLSSILAKLSNDPASQTTLAAILAKLIADPATEAKQDALQTSVNLQAKLTDEQPVRYLTPPQIAGYDPAYDKMQVGTSRDKFRDEFFTFDTANNWEVIQTGTGQAITTNGVLNGSRYLNISTGTAISQETIILSRKSFQLPCKVAFGISISQRIINQEFFVELVSVNSVTGVVEVDATFPSTNLNNALNAAALKFDSTTATSNIYSVRGSGKSELASANTAFGSTTAATGASPNFTPAAYWEINADMEQVSFAASAIDTLAAPTALFKRTQQLIDPAKQYKIRIRVRNLAVAPVSSTDFRLHFVRALDTTRFTVDMARNTGRTTDIAQALPIFSTGGSVAISGTPPVTVSSGTIVANSSNIGAASTGQYTRFRAVVTNVVQTVKATAGNIYGLNIINDNVTEPIYLKIWDAAVATLGSTTPSKTIAIPANGSLFINARSNPFFYCQTNSIKIAITKSKADSAVDAPTIAPIVELEYI